MSILNNPIISNLTNQLNQIGNNHITLNNQKNLLPATTSFGGRVVHWISSHFSSQTAARNKEALQTIAKTVGENFGAGYDQAFENKVQANLNSGKPISARKVATVIHELADMKAKNDKTIADNSKMKNNQIIDSLFKPMDTKVADKLTEILNPIGLILEDITSENLNKIVSQIKELANSRSELSLAPISDNELLECIAEKAEDIQIAVNLTKCKNIVQDLNVTLEKLLQDVYDKNEIDLEVSVILMYEITMKAISSLHAATLEDRVSPNKEIAEALIQDMVEDFSKNLDKIPQNMISNVGENIRPIVATEVSKVVNPSPHFLEAMIEFSSVELQSNIGALISLEHMDKFSSDPDDIFSHEFTKRLLDTPLPECAKMINNLLEGLHESKLSKKEIRSLLRSALNVFEQISSLKLTESNIIRTMYELQLLRDTAFPSFGIGLKATEGQNKYAEIIKFYGYVLFGISSIKDTSVKQLVDRVPSQIFYPSELDKLADAYPSVIHFLPTIEGDDNIRLEKSLQWHISSLYKKIDNFGYTQGAELKDVNLEKYFSSSFLADYYRNTELTINGKVVKPSFKDVTSRKQDEIKKNLKELSNQFDGNPILAGKVLNVLHQGILACISQAVGETKNIMEEMTMLPVQSLPSKTMYDVTKNPNGTYSIGIEHALYKETGAYLQARMQVVVSDLEKDVPTYEVFDAEVAYRV